MAIQKQKIVIVDDEVSFLSIFTKVLENAGFEVKGFSDPKEAILKIPSEKPNLILLDITMPEINGFEVFEKLKNDLKANACKIMFLTNLGETVAGTEVDELYAKDIGADGYLKKTDDLNYFVKKIQEILS
ncbi:MAG: response regulator [Patescibacteria group bacterium]